jgi:hypothetical protein
MNLSISEQLTYSTVRIECVDLNGNQSTGTGYFFKFKVNQETGEHIPVVITNKHVIENAKDGRLIFTKATENNEPIDTEHYPVIFDNFEQQWIKHPKEDVDLCVLPMAPFLNQMTEKQINLFYIPLDMSILPTEEQLSDLSALEDVIMIGYPNGIWDQHNNKPILRKGVTATHPILDYNGKKEFLIDMACFPGSSGSPVFIFNEGGYRDKKGNTFMGKSRILFLGTLYAGPQHTATGEIKVVNISTSTKPIAISKIPNNLGLVIKHNRILELEKLF